MSLTQVPALGGGGGKAWIGCRCGIFGIIGEDTEGEISGERKGTSKFITTKISIKVHSVPSLKREVKKRFFLLLVWRGEPGERGFPDKKKCNQTVTGKYKRNRSCFKI